MRKLENWIKSHFEVVFLLLLGLSLASLAVTSVGRGAAMIVPLSYLGLLAFRRPAE
jgi:hypothetical protein